MNKEQQELLDKVYNNYFKKATPSTEGVIGSIWVNIEEFIDKCKTDTEFSKRWGLKIEERELNPKERIKLYAGQIHDKYLALVEMSLRACDELDIPTKLITLTYNDKTIESYE